MPWQGERPGMDQLAQAAKADPARQFSAPDYWARLRPHLGQWGISRVADITGLDHIGLPVAQAVRPMARSNAVTQGKAATPEGAAVGAVLECLEMAAGEDLSRVPPAPPDPDPLWRELAPGADWPVSGTPFVAAWEITQARPGAVPRDILSTDFTRGAKAEQAPILRQSIGLGAGATLAAALVHGLLECIEADARLLSEVPGHAVLLRLPPDDPQFGPLLRRLADAGLRVRITDITARPGPCVVHASIMEAPGASTLPLPASGYAARPSPAAAVAAALSEAVQARLAVISGAREDITQRFYRHGFDATALEQAWRHHGPGLGTPLPPQVIPDGSAHSLANGFGPVYAVPLVWRPDIPLAVTRIVAPALMADPLRLQPAI